MSLLFNIVSNSYKYTNKGEVCIELKKEVYNNTPTLKLSVKDTGSGIKQDTLNNWGKPFNNEDKNKGTGLGQFIIQRLAKSLGVFIPKPKSIENVGTKFKIYFPLKGEYKKSNSNDYSPITIKQSCISPDEINIQKNVFTQYMNKLIYDDEQRQNINILCLDDCQQILNCFDNYAKKNLKHDNYIFTIKKTSNYFEFINEVNSLLKNNLMFDFLLLDHNLERGNLSGLDCALIGTDIYKRTFSNNNIDKCKVFFLTEEINFWENFKQYEVVKKDRIFGKTEFRKVVDLILNLIE
jgi:hypothetical protein